MGLNPHQDSIMSIFLSNINVLSLKKKTCVSTKLKLRLLRNHSPSPQQGTTPTTLLQIPAAAATPAKAGPHAAPAVPTQSRAPKNPSIADAIPQVAETLLVPISQASADPAVGTIRQDRTTTRRRRVIKPAMVDSLFWARSTSQRFALDFSRLVNKRVLCIEIIINLSL